ncbi:MAG TPA: metallophosphoesterase family protein [Candidatus Acidoferrales bacterium]|nr:metallophosphoesterase family protein [Candidatus Acidoferrales bacterium]
MRIAALYDIHGNLPALEAVLAEVRHHKIDEIVVGGDVVPGPMSRETLALLQSCEIPIQYIRGNCEVAVLSAMAGKDPGPMPESAKETIRWTAKSLYPDFQSVFEGWPKTARIDMPETANVLFCHATPRDENEIFTRLTPEDRLKPIFEKCDADLVVCGHTHMQFEREIAGIRVVNAGSVGMPFGAPGADWLLLGPNIELRHTDYDLEAAAAQIRATNYPDREEFISKYLLHPPDEDTMLKAFTAASMK